MLLKAIPILQTRKQSEHQQWSPAAASYLDDCSQVGALNKKLLDLQRTTEPLARIDGKSIWQTNSQVGPSHEAAQVWNSFNVSRAYQLVAKGMEPCAAWMQD